MGLADRTYMHPGDCCCLSCREEREYRAGKEEALRIAMEVCRLSKIQQEGELYLPRFGSRPPCKLVDHVWSEWGTVSTLPKGWIYKVCSKCGKTYRKRVEKE